MFDRENLIKVIVISQTIKLNGQTHTLIDIPIGEVIDATPIYGAIHNTIIGYYINNESDGYKWERRLPSDLFKPIAKHRQEQIDSIFED
jgi:hypothetical protein